MANMNLILTKNVQNCRLKIILAVQNSGQIEYNWGQPKHELLSLLGI